VPALFIAKNAVLSAFSFGRTTALVIDCGGSTTSVCPVHDGHALRHAMLK
jgi:actin-related protein